MSSTPGGSIPPEPPFGHAAPATELAAPVAACRQPVPSLRPGEGGSVREVVALAGPAVLSMLSVTLMWTTDTFFVGRLGTAEQGAVGFAGVVAWTFCSFFAGSLSAVQIFVAQHVGVRSPRGAGVMTWQGVYWALLASIPVAGLGLLGEPILGALRIDPALLPHAVAYFKIRLLGAAGVFLAFAFEGYLRGVGDTRTPMFATFAANGLNILLDYLLIFGHWGLPRLGVAGAAVATIASGFLQAAILAAAAERRALREGHLVRPVLPPMRREMARLARVGSPIGLQWVLEMGSWSVFTVLVARISEVQAAAHQVATAIIHVSFMPGYGISIAATTLVGQYMGAGDRESALRSARNALRVAIAFMATMGVVFWVGRRELITIFNDDPQVVALGSRLLVFAAIFQVFDATNLVLSGALRGAGDTRFPLVASLVMAWAVFVPLSWFLCVRLGWGVVGGWLAVILWTIGLAVVLRQRFAGRRWMEKVLVQQAEGMAERG